MYTGKVSNGGHNGKRRRSIGYVDLPFSDYIYFFIYLFMLSLFFLLLFLLFSLMCVCVGAASCIELEIVLPTEKSIVYNTKT